MITFHSNFKKKKMLRIIRNLNINELWLRLYVLGVRCDIHIFQKTGLIYFSPTQILHTGSRPTVTSRLPLSYNPISLIKDAKVKKT